MSACGHLAKILLGRSWPSPPTRLYFPYAYPVASSAGRILRSYQLARLSIGGLISIRALSLCREGLWRSVDISPPRPCCQQLQDGRLVHNPFCLGFRYTLVHIIYRRNNFDTLTWQTNTRIFSSLPLWPYMDLLHNIVDGPSNARPRKSPRYEKGLRVGLPRTPPSWMFTWEYVSMAMNWSFSNTPVSCCSGSPLLLNQQLRLGSVSLEEHTLQIPEVSFYIFILIQILLPAIFMAQS